MKTKIIGAGIFLAAAAIIIIFTVNKQNEAEAVTLNGYVGGEKIGFLEDEKIISILQNKYKISMSYKKMGSLDMARADVSGMDFIFPSSSFAAELYKINGGESMRSEDAFVSPLVIYSWDIVTDALIEKGIAQRRGDGVYTLDMLKFTELMKNNSTWADLGVNELYGQIFVYSTDPVQSNSGNLYAALTAAMLNAGNTVRKSDIPNISDSLNDILSKSGYKDTSSSDLFNHYLRTGVGGKAMVALYENQIIEFAKQNPTDWDKIKDKVRVLYPVPTIWSNHCYIAVSENGARFFDAMTDREIKKLAWESHGFRIDASSGENLTPAMKSAGIAEQITQVIGIPDYGVMSEIIKNLE